MKTSSIAVETSRSTTQSDSIVRQTNKRSSYLSYTTMNNKQILNDIKFRLFVCLFVFLKTLQLKSLPDKPDIYRISKGHAKFCYLAKNKR